MNDPCNTSYNNKQHLIQSVTCADLFTRISPLECLCYTMLNMPINIEQMLEKISNITFLSSLNTTHSFQFTFVLIGEHVVDTFQVHAICVTYNKLADLDSKMLRDKQSEKSFKMQQMLGAYGFDQFILSACSHHPLKVRNLVQSKAYTPKSCSSTP